MPQCAEKDCEREAGVMLYVPWEDDRPVCAAHARSLVQRDGVVAMPLEDADEEWPDGAGNS